MYLNSSYFYEFENLDGNSFQRSPDYEEVEDFSPNDEGNGSFYDNVSNSVRYFDRNRISYRNNEASNRPVAAVKPFFYDASNKLRQSLPPSHEYTNLTSYRRMKKLPAPPPPGVYKPVYPPPPPMPPYRPNPAHNIQRSI